MNEIGVPLSITEALDDFWHFLMHGYHPSDATGFEVNVRDERQSELMFELLDAYLDAGLPNPGIGCISSDVRARLAAKHPHAVSPPPVSE